MSHVVETVETERERSWEGKWLPAQIRYIWADTKASLRPTLYAQHTDSDLNLLPNALGACHVTFGSRGTYTARTCTLNKT